MPPAAVGLQGPGQPAWLTRAADFVAQLFGCLALYFARVICSIRCLQVRVPGVALQHNHTRVGARSVPASSSSDGLAPQTQGGVTALW